ncbi:hypothetical protein D6C86_10601 [Aureobasidium pullulans]|uniref:Zn(2)-C6 fungal-type domain-containing protein n=1 Tax=Aureobasidium pullulans TaxID=5580 RepID=A0A4S9UB21_AURPU|nr:hypothetical protein D6C94_10713 [Aureobasidium pullulans]THZ34577.1 hypothetical protein D6C87_10349 [Aureobasidium pullulans]THZ50970.1 hypothetical protein D6C86_10601 [Aureobasidium pullulans]
MHRIAPKQILQFGQCLRTCVLSSVWLITSGFALHSAFSTSVYNSMASDHQRVASGSREARPRSFDGCQTCRKRRVKCDESRPRCSACERLDRPCSWTRDWKFKDHTALVAGGYRVLIESGSLDQYGPASRDAIASLQWQPAWNIGSREANRNHSLECPLQQSQRWQTLRLREHLLPPNLNHAPIERSQLLNSALFYFLPSDEHNLGRSSLEESGSINILTLYNRSLSDPQSLALEAAIDAFSLAQAALVLGEARLASASVRRYVAGVAALRSALTRAQDSNRDETILAMLIFQFIEVMRPTSQNGGWAVHTAGVQRFVETLGPWRLHDRYQGALFDQVRQTAILWGILHREEIPFHQNRWIYMSQAAITVTHERRLVDIGTTLPSLLVATDNLLQDSDKNTNFISVWRNLKHVRETLLAWVHHYDAHNRFAIKACDTMNFPAYSNHMGTTGDLLRHACVFHRFSDAWFMSTAWIYLYAIQSALLRVTQVIRGIATNEFLEELRKSVHTTVWDMCQTIPKFFDRSSGFIGRICIFLSSKLRKMYFEAIGDFDMVLWCQKVDAYLHLRGGVAPFWMSSWDHALRPCLGEANRSAEEFNGVRLRL